MNSKVSQPSLFTIEQQRRHGEEFESWYLAVIAKQQEFLKLRQIETAFTSNEPVYWVWYSLANDDASELKFETKEEVICDAVQSLFLIDLQNANTHENITNIIDAYLDVNGLDQYKGRSYRDISTELSNMTEGLFVDYRSLFIDLAIDALEKAQNHGKPIQASTMHLSEVVRCDKCRFYHEDPRSRCSVLSLFLADIAVDPHKDSICQSFKPSDGRHMVVKFFMRNDLFGQVKEYMAISLGSTVSDDVAEAFLARHPALMGSILEYDEIDTQDRSRIWECCRSDFPTAQ
jgi:hypothetical protein